MLDADRYDIIIGLEVHVQLLTQTKLFCGCSTKFGAPPNTQTCPVCLGLPGALPVMNRRAFELARGGALDRGEVGATGSASGARRIGIIRVHLEEDAGKGMHDEAAGTADSRIDLNRAGTPLLEIVTQPDLRSPAEAKAFLTELKLLLTYLNVSDCNMQEGSLRVDGNINLHIH